MHPRSHGIQEVVVQKFSLSQALLKLFGVKVKCMLLFAELLLLQA